MNVRDIQCVLFDIATRVSFFRAGRVGALWWVQSPNYARIAPAPRSGWVRRVVATVCVVCALSAVRAEAESCEQRCPQVREEGFSSVSEADGTSQVCCCLIDDSGQSASQPLEQCEKIP
ncbi:MAG: hypothetical protein EBZ48_10755 [Proteobacteria bacterium]|nr:hypothetical protein [Pseudomonadota bacterium]